MKFLKSAFVNIPDQVISTVIIWGVLFIMYRGAINIFKDPPSKQTILGVVIIGVFLGLVFAMKDASMSDDPENTDYYD